MSAYRAFLYRLFAKGSHPARALRVRLVLFTLVLCLAGMLAYRLTPGGYQPSDPSDPSSGGPAVAVIVATTTCLVSILYFLFNSYQNSLLRRLNIVHYMPLSLGQVRSVYALSFAPIAAVCMALCVPMVSKFFGAAWLLPALVCLLAVMCNTLLRIRFAKLAQAITACLVLWSGTIGWSLQGELSTSAARLNAALLVAIQFVLICLSARGKIVAREQVTAHRVKEYKQVTLMTMSCLRAVRNRRYRGANALLVVVWLGLTGLVAFKPGVLPYDAVIVATVVLLGTVIQEARYLSNRVYPLELVRFGLVRQWFCAMGLLVAVTLVGWFVLTSVVTGLYFAHELSVSWGYSMMLACCLAVSALTIVCILAPQRSDIFMQLFATVLYAAAVWLVFKLFAWADEQWLPWLTTSFVLLGCTAAYWVERVRWTTTIRRKHGYIF